MDEFDRLFPPKKHAFGVNAVTADFWRTELEAGGLIVTGRYMLLADDCLKRCLSWYEHRNLFAHPSFSILLNQFREANATMAKKSFSRTPAIDKAKFEGFVERKLTDEELEALDGWDVPAMELFSYVDQLLTGGIKVSLSYNPNTKLATCSLMDERKKLDNGEPNPAAGRMLSTGDTNSALALKAAVYKHFHALEMDWSPLIAAPSQGGRRG